MPHEKDPSKKDRAIALWRLSNILRCNKDPKLHAIATAVDTQAIRYAKEAGHTYNELMEAVEEGTNDGDIAAVMDYM